MPDPTIFKATYSGIPVYEMMCKGVAVMRRRSDAWLNATQILKVAGFDKPQRTRVLEREVQKGEHEKVQGGYGKYQGTWIPLERGLVLAKQYNCEHLLKPIIDFQPAAKSPPLAPKHLVSTGAGVSRPSRRTHADGPAAVVNTRSSRRQVQSLDPASDDQETLSVAVSEDGSMTPSPSEASSSSRTPSPINSPEPYSSNGINSRRRRRSVDNGQDNGHHSVSDARAYGDQILEYFISDTNQVPAILINPPIDFDPNMAIDDDGHTALHWACAMGRIRIVKLLLTAGADIFKVNKAGQTPLMRSVMFANNYDVRKFPELYELLHRSTLNIDNYNRTVFHHVVDVAMSKGKSHAARYYMETILTRLADYPKELADVINFQDEDGETALTMAARCRSKRLVKILIDHGADPKIVNNDGKSTEDYILEDERFRSSPVPPSRAMTMPLRSSQVPYPPSHPGPNYSFGLGNGERPPLHHSVAGQRASTRCVNDMTSMLDSLAASFDQELRDKERDTTQAHALLSNIQAEILESQRAVGHLRAQAESLPQTKQGLAGLEYELQSRMGQRSRLGWEKWVSDEEGRERIIREAAGGALVLTPATALIRVEEERTTPEHPQGADQDEAARGAKRKASTQMEDVADLVELHNDIPQDPEALQRACNLLREELGSHRKRRKQIFDELVSVQAEAGTSGKMADYRRLIGAGCGGILPSEVDSVLTMLLETLESEEPSSSTTAWDHQRRLRAKRPCTLNKLLLFNVETLSKLFDIEPLKARKRFHVLSFLPSSVLRPRRVMPLRRLTKFDIIRGVTKNPWTSNFRHLLPVSKILNAKLKAPTIENFSRKVVPANERIKYWNIVPGDQVRLLGDKSSTIREVTAINKFRNRVYVRGVNEKVAANTRPKDKNFHYSRCQLFLGEHELPLKPGETERRLISVFAQRLGTSSPAWNSHYRTWQWDRFATKVTPTIPERRGERISIPWPTPKPKIHGEATSYDTSKEDVLRVTFQPPPFSPTLRGVLPRVPTEAQYLRALYNHSHQPFFAGSQPPVEQFLYKELSNPHSRAKKMKRWQETRRAKRALLDDYIREEVRESRGRIVGQAKADAAFRWRQTLHQDKQALRKMKWIQRGGQEKLERKIQRRARKEEKQKLRLASLTLKEEPNQFIPKDLAV
ncbi:hypothetical protein D9757_000333 [Collybiopsis confluens]|uniref:HTH APSES-type domain-containing protein n=1 Tax=Collybiopsis confluens TaxID=2823264 RepID=A0A8H5I2I5_9AGAR|nr:hypothetical protein D9757_000333 [Collybiopsis confluens]